MTYYWLKSNGKILEISNIRFRQLRLANIRNKLGYLLVVDSGRMKLWINKNDSTIEIRKSQLKKILEKG